MSSFMNRPPQLQGEFTPGDPTGGYYNDLRSVASDYGNPEQALGWFELFAQRRERAWPVSLLQLGLGAWQQCAAGDDRWLPVVRVVSDWTVVDMDGYGRFVHHQEMPHTYDIQPPWYSAMAQGQGASLLVRAAHTLDRPELTAQAVRAIEPLLSGEHGLLLHTADGPVLQEYPSNPPAHVLNGWIWALWGLYDVACAGDHSNVAWEVAATSATAAARAAFNDGVEALANRLGRYDIGRGNWSRYDLYPHPVTNVASPFYHRLHIEMLRALNELEPREAFTDAANRWEAGLASPSARIAAVARKVGFRMLRPRRQAA